ncbi:MAG TPA: DUF5939 domain-containing protein [Polyangiaceae bacterium]|nr:DUF5939 domain-containing protein [Polyangiaceae bacterium]
MAIPDDETWNDEHKKYVIEAEEIPPRARVVLAITLPPTFTVVFDPVPTPRRSSTYKALRPVCDKNWCQDDRRCGDGDLRYARRRPRRCARHAPHHGTAGSAVGRKRLNIAARVQGLAEGRAIYTTEPLVRDAAVASLLANAGPRCVAQAGAAKRDQVTS